MAIFLRPDVGWGQTCNSDCPELVLNQNLIFNTENLPHNWFLDNWQTFNIGRVDHWEASHGSPHHFNSALCTSQWNNYNPAVIKPCLGASYFSMEGIYTEINFSEDPYVEYCLNFDLQKMDCPKDHNIQLIASVTKNLVPIGEDPITMQPPFEPLNENQQLESKDLIGHDFTVYHFSRNFKPTVGKNYNQLWFRMRYIDTNTEQAQNGGIGVLSNISIRCETSALGGIDSEKLALLEYRFSTINLSSLSDFVSYVWNFDDPNSGNNTSVDDTPIHIFTQSGTYNVCVEIEDENGCCASICDEVTVGCPEILAVFTYTDDCPLYTFTPTSPMPGYSYHWTFGDGSTSSIQKPTKVYSANGTFNVCLTITDEDGCTETFCQNVLVTCSIPWACTPTPGFNYIYIDARPSRNISDFYPLINTINNQRLIIRGRLIIDKNFSILSCPHILMEPGAEIHVAYEKRLTFALNKLVEGCTQMWKGMTTEGRLNVISNSKIKDAFHAINLLDGGVAAVNNNKFDENFIGIHSGDTGSSVNMISFTANDFNSLGLLKPAYTGFAVDYPHFSGYFAGAARSFAGIYLRNQNNLNLSGNGPSSINSFTGLKNGLVAENSSFTFKNAEIKDLAGSTYDSPVAGYGVWAKRGSSIDVDNISVENAYVGVFVDNALWRTRRVSVQNSSFTNIDPSFTETGNTVRISNCAGGDITVDNNMFTNTTLPIDLWEVNNFTSLSISDNGTTANPMTYVRGFGIKIGNSSSLGVYSVIANNVMSTTNGSFGISVGRSNNVAVHNNKVTINNPNNSSNITGIDINVSDGCEVRENDVVMNLASNPNSSRGIALNLSPNTLYCCNNITGGHHGVRFSGMSTNTRFKQNTIRNATNAGLYLFYTTIGQQFSTDNSGIKAYGNIWEGANLANRTAFADGNVVDNQFRVDPLDNSLILIPGFIRTFLPTPNVNQWFESATAATPLCSTNPLCNEDMFQGNGPWICGNLQAIGDLENSIAGVNGNLPYAPQELWTAQNYAYEYITAHPQLLAYSTPLTNFYNSPGAPILAYQSIEQNINNMYDLTPSEQTAWNNSSTASATDIAALDAINAQVTEANFDALYPSMLPYMATISYHYGIMNDINEDVEIRAIINATNIRAQIASMPGSQSFLAQYKLIRMIYMDYIIHGKAYVLSTYLSQINDIASRCQLIYGESVTLARGMQAALGLEVTITEGSCVPVIPKSKISDEIAVYNVVPNPSSEDWTANIDGISVATNINYTLTDLQGRIVSQYNGTVYPEQTVTISGVALAPGVYILNMEVANVKMEPRKLIKIQ